MKDKLKVGMIIEYTSAPLNGLRTEVIAIEEKWFKDKVVTPITNFEKGRITCTFWGSSHKFKIINKEYKDHLPRWW